MNKFDQIISTKLTQLNEVDATQTSAAPVTAPATAGATTQATQAPAQATTEPAAQTQTAATPEAKPATPDQALANVFKTMKFGDSKASVQAMNNALKTSGNIPGIKEFFGSLAFDPKTGQFTTVKSSQAQAGAAPVVAPAAQ